MPSHIGAAWTFDTRVKPCQTKLNWNSSPWVIFITVGKVLMSSLAAGQLGRRAKRIPSAPNHFTKKAIPEPSLLSFVLMLRVVADSTWSKKQTLSKTNMTTQKILIIYILIEIQGKYSVNIFVHQNEHFSSWSVKQRPWPKGRSGIGRMWTSSAAGMYFLPPKSRRRIKIRSNFASANRQLTQHLKKQSKLEKMRYMNCDWQPKGTKEIIVQSGSAWGVRLWFEQWVIFPSDQIETWLHKPNVVATSSRFIKGSNQSYF